VVVKPFPAYGLDQSGCCKRVDPVDFLPSADSFHGAGCIRTTQSCSTQFSIPRHQTAFFPIIFESFFLFPLALI
jgi:hypothetical protein